MYRITKGHSNWYKIIDFFQKLTAPTKTDDKKATYLFKQSMEIMFNLWWKDETEREGSKLDFYFSIKKSFGFEKYLDKIPYSARTAITKLRLSCHCLPVEVLRYNKNKNKIERKDRTCNICTMNKVGDEKHYLTECQNKGLVDIRQKFILEMKKTCPQMKFFSDENIVDYCISMKDENTQESTAKFVHDLISQYKKEDKVPPLSILCLRFMRKIRGSNHRT